MIIVEDGSGVANANSYVSEAELEAFALARGITITGDPEVLLIQSMDYIESLSYQGRKIDRYQSLQWPRIGVVIDGWMVASNFIPLELKNGQMQTALSIDAGSSPQQTIGRKTKREKVGDLEIEYADSSVTNSIDPKIMSFLSKLLSGGAGFGSNVINVGKA